MPLDLQKFRTRLLQEKKRILQHLYAMASEELRQELDWGEPKDLEEWGNITLSEELMNRIAWREIYTVEEIDEALKRIEEGTYGVCEKCGNPIEEERLEFLPWARYCARCARAAAGES